MYSLKSGFRWKMKVCTIFVWTSLSKRDKIKNTGGKGTRASSCAAFLSFPPLQHTFPIMKLHLPVSLRRALICALAAGAAASSGSASAAWEAKDDLGKTMYVGDSITHGAYANLYSWRWSMHKIFADNGISYTEVGVMTGNGGNAGVNMPYGETVFQNKHSAQNSARAFEIAERKQKYKNSGAKDLRFGGTGIQHWLGLSEPSGWTGEKSASNYRLSDTEKPVNTFFLLIGTNDLLSESPNIGASLTTKEQELLGRSGSSESVIWTGAGDMDTIVNAMFEDNSDASVVILTVPTWGAHGNNNTAADYKAVQTYNEHLEAWVKQNRHGEKITLIDINRGLVDVANTDKPWEGVDSFFYASDGRLNNDHLHPSAQGELIIAGNVVRGLGYAGRTAGQERKGATAFNRQAQALYESATSKDNVTWAAGTGLTLGSDSTFTSGWGDASPEGTFTVDFKLNGGLGNGEEGGWDTQNGLTITVGDGTHAGALTLNEAYIKWGDTILYSMDMSGLDSALRVAYVRGRNSQGLTTGFYVWLDDQLIGEALGSGATMENGLSITNETGASITLSELAMDSTGSWSPTSEGFTTENPPLITPADSSDCSGWPGVVDWPGQGEMLGETQALTAGNALNPSLFTDGKIGCTVTVNGKSPDIIKNWSGEQELFVTVTKDSNPTSWLALDNVNDGTSTVNLHVRFSGEMTLPTIFCVFQNKGTTSYYHDGDVYVEFSGDPTVNSATYTMVDEDSNYANHSPNDTHHAPSISAFFTNGGNGAKEKGAVNGKITYVINNGTYNGRIIGGEAYGVQGNETRVTKGVEIYLNGGTFKGDIYAGGTCGYIGGATIVITGGLGTMTFEETVQRISAGGFGQQNAGGVANGGTATVVLQNITEDDGIANYKGEISGGRKPDDYEVRRTLELKNVVLSGGLAATLAEFDEVEVTDGSELSLGAFGGATKLTVTGSVLTLTDTGVYTGMTTRNGGTIILGDGVSYETRTDVESDDQIAASLSGVYEVQSTASLQLSADAEGRVRGGVDVQLHGGGVYKAGLTGDEEGADRVVVTLLGGETGELTLQNGRDEGNALIRVKLQDFTTDTRVKGWTEDGRYTLQLTDETHVLRLGDSVKDEAKASIFDTKGQIILGEKASLSLEIDGLPEAPTDQTEVRYHVTQGDLSDWNGNEQVQISQELAVSGWDGTWSAEGDLVLTYTRDERPKYESSEDNDGADWEVEPDENMYDAVGKYDSVEINSETRIDFSGEERIPWRWFYTQSGLTLHNLWGTDDGELTIIGDGKTNNTVTFKNSYEKQDDGQTQTDGTLRYRGKITIEGAALHISHEDPEEPENGANWCTRVEGKLDLSEGQGLFMDTGALTLASGSKGEVSHHDLGAQGVTFTNGNDGQLVIDGSLASLAGKVSAEGETRYATDRKEHILLKNGGELQLGSSDSANETEVSVTIGAEDEQMNIVHVQGKVGVGKEGKLQNVHLLLEKGAELHLERGEKGEPQTKARSAEDDTPVQYALNGLQSNGGGIRGNGDVTITVKDVHHEFSGDLSGYNGTMTIAASNYAQSFSNVKGGYGWDMKVEKGAVVLLDVLGSSGRNAGWTMGDLVLSSGSETTLLFSFAGSNSLSSASGTGLNFESFTMERGAQLVLQAVGNAMPTRDTFTLGRVASGEVKLNESADGLQALAEEGDRIELQKDQLLGAGFLHVKKAAIVKKDQRVDLEMEMSADNILEEAVMGEGHNALEGARALWKITGEQTSQAAQKLLSDPDSDLNRLVERTIELYNNGNHGALARTLAGAMGASLSALAPAVSQDVHRQLISLRNRALGLPSASIGTDDPDCHMWLNAESAYHELDDDGMEPGFRLSGWGGSVGLATHVDEYWTLGLAMNAMYNDLKSDGVDQLRGDVDTVYANVFLRYRSGHWTHLLELSEGMVDVETRRTIPTVGYTTSGSTDGYVFGALYELSFAAYLDEEARKSIEFVMNAEVRYTSLNGFEETGSDVGLGVQDVDSTQLTLGAGARWSARGGAQALNRSALLEARALLKADAGDRRGEVATRLSCGDYVANMRSAEVGMFGAEFGVGVTVPLGSRAGDIFMDAGVELRRGWKSMEASVGYRINF